ncbi:MAG: nucleotidyltransferase domain-containing protein [Defluviitaleaceae bacterium]|nr:nucleotidyltransferase domain-containing protein [Defluviitaleaceae bacterium]
MDTRIIKIVEKYADIIKSRHNPLKVYLYGSHAKGAGGNQSDIDVAVVFPELEASNYMNIFGDLFSIATDVDTRLEPNMFIDDGVEDKYSMLYEVLRTGYEIS